MFFRVGYPPNHGKRCCGLYDRERIRIKYIGPVVVVRHTEVKVEVNKHVKVGDLYRAVWDCVRNIASIFHYLTVS
jgi:hypothetical protein